MKMRCPICKAGRSRLHKCVICQERRCGCCSVKSILNDKRICCYPGDGKRCINENRQQYKAEREATNTSTHDTAPHRTEAI
jgi:hypothetical protein